MSEKSHNQIPSYSSNQNPKDKENRNLFLGGKYCNETLCDYSSGLQKYCGAKVSVFRFFQSRHESMVQSHDQKQRFPHFFSMLFPRGVSQSVFFHHRCWEEAKSISTVSRRLDSYVPRKIWLSLRILTPSFRRLVE